MNELSRYAWERAIWSLCRRFGGDERVAFSKASPFRGAVLRQQGQRPSGSIWTRRWAGASGYPLGEPTALCSPWDESVIVGYTL